MLQMHNVNITNAYMYNYIPPCRCKLYARVITCALFVAVDEAGSPSVVWHISMGLSVSHVYLEKLSFILPNVASRASLYYTEL